MAKRFDFSLQKVLEVRQHLENKQAVQVFKSRAVLKTEESKLLNLKDKKYKTMSSQSREANDKVSLNNLKVSGQYIEQLNRNIELQGRKVTESNKVVKKEIQKLNEAVKDKKVVQKLKDRHWEEHKKTLNQEFNKQQDEVASRVVKNAQ